MRGLKEVIFVEDIYCSGLGGVEMLDGGSVRFHLYASHSGGSDDAQAEKIVVAKIVMPLSAVPDAVQRTLAVTNAAEGAAPADAASRLH